MQDFPGTSTIATDDGGFAETGMYRTYHMEIFLRKMDTNGNELWVNQETYNSSPFDDAGYGLIKLLAAKLARNPIPSRTFLVFCSLTPQQSWRGMRSPEFNRMIRDTPLLEEPGRYQLPVA